MCHEMINNNPPILQARMINLEESVIQKQIEDVFLPSLPCILVTTQTRQKLRARLETRHIPQSVRLQIRHDIIHQRC